MKAFCVAVLLLWGLTLPSLADVSMPSCAVSSAINSTGKQSLTMS